MNLNWLINRVMRKAMNIGVSKGIDAVAGKGKAKSEMTPEERESAKNAQQNAKRARQGMNVMRRFMR